ncbi:hypothetical protein Ddc_15480 [Ditylenchus destructor]|nr:hypothetical protein Ddc_15480 [Ditylenchus destructor]
MDPNFPDLFTPASFEEPESAQLDKINPTIPPLEQNIASVDGNENDNVCQQNQTFPSSTSFQPTTNRSLISYPAMSNHAPMVIEPYSSDALDALEAANAQQAAQAPAPAAGQQPLVAFGPNDFVIEPGPNSFAQSGSNFAESQTSGGSQSFSSLSSEYARGSYAGASGNRAGGFGSTNHPLLPAMSTHEPMPIGSYSSSNNFCEQIPVNQIFATTTSFQPMMNGQLISHPAMTSGSIIPTSHYNSVHSSNYWVSNNSYQQSGNGAEYQYIGNTYPSNDYTYRNRPYYAAQQGNSWIVYNTQQSSNIATISTTTPLSDQNTMIVHGNSSYHCVSNNSYQTDSYQSFGNGAGYQNTFNGYTYYDDPYYTAQQYNYRTVYNTQQFPSSNTAIISTTSSIMTHNQSQTVNTQTIQGSSNGDNTKYICRVCTFNFAAEHEKGERPCTFACRACYSYWQDYRSEGLSEHQPPCKLHYEDGDKMCKNCRVNTFDKFAKKHLPSYAAIMYKMELEGSKQTTSSGKRSNTAKRSKASRALPSTNSSRETSPIEKRYRLPTEIPPFTFVVNIYKNHCKLHNNDEFAIEYASLGYVHYEGDKSAFTVYSGRPISSAIAVLRLLTIKSNCDNINGRYNILNKKPPKPEKDCNTLNKPVSAWLSPRRFIKRTEMSWDQPERYIMGLEDILVPILRIMLHFQDHLSILLKDLHLQTVLARDRFTSKLGSYCALMLAFRSMHTDGIIMDNIYIPYQRSEVQTDNPIIDMIYEYFYDPLEVIRDTEKILNCLFVGKPEYALLDQYFLFTVELEDLEEGDRSKIMAAKRKCRRWLFDHFGLYLADKCEKIAKKAKADPTIQWTYKYLGEQLDLLQITLERFDLNFKKALYKCGDDPRGKKFVKKFGGIYEKLNIYFSSGDENDQANFKQLKKKVGGFYGMETLSLLDNDLSSVNEIPKSNKVCNVGQEFEESVLSNQSDIIFLSEREGTGRMIRYKSPNYEQQSSYCKLHNFILGQECVFSANRPEFSFNTQNRVTAKSIDCLSDGNCLFRALSICVSSTEDNHERIRRIVGEFIQEKRGKGEKWCALNLERGIEIDDALEPCANATEEDKWGCGSHILAFSKWFGCNILVHNCEQWTIFTPLIDTHPDHGDVQDEELPTFALINTGVHYKVIDYLF